MSDDTPPLVPDPLPEHEQEAIIDLLAGMPAQEAAEAHGITVARVEELTQTSDYLDAQHLRVADIHRRMAALSQQAVTTITANLLMEAQHNTELGFKYLKEIGAFKKMGKELQLDPDDANNQPAVAVQINTFGADIAFPDIEDAKVVSVDNQHGGGND